MKEFIRLYFPVIRLYGYVTTMNEEEEAVKSGGVLEMGGVRVKRGKGEVIHLYFNKIKRTV